VFANFERYATLAIAAVSVFGISLHLVLRFGFASSSSLFDFPLFVVLATGGVPLIVQLTRRLIAFEFGSDLVGGVSIVTSVVLGEYLAGSIIVLMLSGGEALERYALGNASSVLDALVRRMPTVAHRKLASVIRDVMLHEIAIDDVLVIYPHEICPVDGVVTDGRGVMDESYLTGEPFEMTKTVGSAVLSGAINGDTALTVRAVRRAGDSRYAKIMEVIQTSERLRPRLRRLGDRLGALYTPLALSVALAAWLVSGDSKRFLSVLVIATPCPLLIAIPVAIIGSISLAARRSIIVRSPVALERVSECRTAIFDKTGTLTYGTPAVTDVTVAAGFARPDVVQLVASLERYSKHPLARAILDHAAQDAIQLLDCSEVSEPPGQGLRGKIEGRTVEIVSRRTLLLRSPTLVETLPAPAGGLECVAAIDGCYAALYQFRDAPRKESRSFVTHLGPRHHFTRLLIVSGDRESEVQYLAGQVGIDDVFANQSPEQKLALVRQETRNAPTLYVGDGINDAPAMMAATVGVAIGANSDVTTEAAGVIIMDNSLAKVDEFLHISRRMRTVALQSALGGIVLSLGGMAIAATGHLSPVAGAITQEVIDVLAVVNALRAASPPSVFRDF
jgi:heavy metal translocating P-type ATPase